MKTKQSYLQKLFIFPRVVEQGSILIVALWVLAILGSLAISSGYQARQKIMLADRLNLRDWLYGAAEIGAFKAIEMLKEEDTSQSYETMSELGVFANYRFANMPAGKANFTVGYDFVDPETGVHKLRYGVQDESGKLNLNTAEAVNIIALLQILGVDEDVAKEIGHSVVDWRDPDNSLSHPSDGAEDDYYKDLNNSYEAMDRPFEILNELLLVRSMTPEIFEKVKDKVTIYGGTGVNINTASKEVLLALGIEESAVTSILDYRRGKDGEEGTNDDQYFMQAEAITASLTGSQQLSGSELASVSNLIATGKLVVKSGHFMIHSIGTVNYKATAVDIWSVVSRTGKILSWSSGVPRKMTPLELEAAQEDV